MKEVKRSLESQGRPKMFALKILAFVVVVLCICIVTLISRYPQRYNQVGPPFRAHALEITHDSFDTCNTFTFSTAKRTLYWKKPFSNLESKRCRNLHDSIFKDKRVTWIVFPNGTTKNLDCTSCKEIAYMGSKKSQIPHKRPITPDKRLWTSYRRPIEPDKRPSKPHRRPSAPDKGPSIPHRIPVTPDKRPSIPHRKPSIPINRQNIPQRRPNTSDKRPRIPQRRPSTQEKRPSIPDKRQSIPDKRPSITQRRPSILDKRPSIPHRIPNIPDKRPSIPDKRPSIPDKRPSITQKTPSILDKRPSIPHRIPNIPDKTPSIPDKRPSIPDKRPSITQRRPSIPDKRPSIPHRIPNIPDKRPNTLRKAPRTQSNSSFDRCTTFNFVPADWTLYWKAPYSEKDESIYCRNIHRSIFKEKKVKWIEYPNGKSKNLGCTRFTATCKEHPYFDRKRKIRINYNPCCRRHMAEMLRVVTGELQRLKVPHVLIGGAIIGWARNKKFIPYDMDFDIFVQGSFWNTPRMRSYINTLHSHGFVTKFRDSGQKLWILYSETNRLNQIDLWPMKRKNGKIHIYNFANVDQPYSNIFPLKYVNFSGILTYIPNKPEAYNDVQYGKNWRKELKCTKIEGRHCVT